MAESSLPHRMQVCSFKGKFTFKVNYPISIF